MHDARLLGLAIRARWVGYAALGAHRHLLDWGMIFYQRSRPHQLISATKRLESLLGRINPSTIVVALPTLKANEEIAAVQSIAMSLRFAAASRSIKIIRLRRSVLRAAFAPRNARSKREIALRLAEAFPELAWKLPPERKIWKKEDPSMAIFDALAGAVAYRETSPGNTGP